MLLIITSTGDRLLGFINIDDLERPWTLKILILSDFLAIFGCKRVNCDKIYGDRLRLPANRNCYRLSWISWALLKLLVFIHRGINCIWQRRLPLVYIPMQFRDICAQSRKLSLNVLNFAHFLHSQIFRGRCPLKVVPTLSPPSSSTSRGKVSWSYSLWLQRSFV